MTTSGGSGGGQSDGPSSLGDTPNPGPGSPGTPQPAGDTAGSGPQSTIRFEGGDAAPGRVPPFMKATLRVLRGREVGRVYPVVAAVTMIGRGDADVLLEDEMTSRRHA